MFQEKDKSKHPMFGRLHSKESKEKNSKSRKGKCVGINNPNSKRVKCFSKENIFIKEFICMDDISSEFKTVSSLIEVGKELVNTGNNRFEKHSY